MKTVKTLLVSISLLCLALGAAWAGGSAQQAGQGLGGKKRISGYQMRGGIGKLTQGWGGHRSTALTHHRLHGTLRMVTPASSRGKTPAFAVRAYRQKRTGQLIVKRVSAGEAKAKGLRTQSEAAGIANQLARRQSPKSARGQYAGITYKGLSKSGKSYIFGVQTDKNDLIAVPVKAATKRVAVFERGAWSRQTLSKSVMQQAAQLLK